MNDDSVNTKNWAIAFRGLRFNARENVSKIAIGGFFIGPN